VRVSSVATKGGRPTQPFDDYGHGTHVAGIIAGNGFDSSGRRSGMAPAARLGAYQASKFAVLGLAETLRMELDQEGIDVCVVFPSGMLTRHLESSAAARPVELGPGEVADEDLTAMMASRPMTEADLTTAEVAASAAVDGVLAGERYVITHGDLAEPVAARQQAIDRALEVLAGRPS